MIVGTSTTISAWRRGETTDDLRELKAKAESGDLDAKAMLKMLEDLKEATSG